MDDVVKFKDILENAGYHFRGNAGIQGRTMFAKGSDDLRTHYIHVEVFNGTLWNNHIYLRNYLRIDKKSVDEYSIFKKELAVKFAMTEFHTLVLKMNLLVLY